METAKGHLAFGFARFIKAEEAVSAFSFDAPAPLFRKEFFAPEEVREAKLFVVGLGFACCYINGAPVTQDVFTTPFSDYSKILWYNEYDVTPLVKPGKNAFLAMVGNGFFNESFRTPWKHDLAPWRDTPQILVRLLLDGKEVLISDETWRASLEHSPVRFNHLRSGEYVDAAKEGGAWLYPDYDDGGWSPVLLRKQPFAELLRPVCCPPVVEAERIPPIAIRETAEGLLVDFGVTISGYAEFTLQAPRGREISFRYTEDLDPSLRPKYNGMNERTFKYSAPFHLNKLIASGGKDTFKPRFSYHGFRYVLVEGLDSLDDMESAYAFFVHQNIGRRSEFFAENPILQYIYDAGIRSTYSNMLWCMTDCPTREKLGWANDAQATAEQTLINFDILPLYEKWFADILAAMREDGALPGIIPTPGWGFDCGPICDGLLYEIPYRTYLYTGNDRMLREGIPYFERYIRYLQSKPMESHTFWLGDWMGHGNNEQIPYPFVWRFYLLKAMKISAFAYRLLGKESSWEEEYQRERASFLRDYLTPDGKCVIPQQSSIAMMLANGLYEDAHPLGEQLEEVVRQDCFTLTCGMVGVQYLYDALTLCHHPEYALRMITESEPGYKTWYESGATTLWESWNGKDIGSKNHHMFSGVIAWFYKSLLGIAPKEDSPAFAEISLSPQFLAGLGSVRGEMRTVRGTIRAEWKETEESFLYTVSLPQGIRADFRGTPLPPGESSFLIKKSLI